VLRNSGGKRVRDADEVVATIAARRIVEHLEGARYRVMKRPLAERAARSELTALSPSESEDVVKAIAFGLRFESGRHVWQADEYMAIITAKCLIEHLTLDGFVVLKLRRSAVIRRSGRGSKASLVPVHKHMFLLA
jgi:hypothetical protein